MGCPMSRRCCEIWEFVAPNLSGSHVSQKLRDVGHPRILTHQQIKMFTRHRLPLSDRSTFVACHPIRSASVEQAICTS